MCVCVLAAMAWLWSSSHPCPVCGTTLESATIVWWRSLRVIRSRSWPASVWRRWSRLWHLMPIITVTGTALELLPLMLVVDHSTLFILSATLPLGVTVVNSTHPSVWLSFCLSCVHFMHRFPAVNTAILISRDQCSRSWHNSMVPKSVYCHTILHCHCCTCHSCHTCGRVATHATLSWWPFAASPDLRCRYIFVRQSSFAYDSISIYS